MGTDSRRQLTQRRSRIDSGRPDVKSKSTREKRPKLSTEQHVCRCDVLRGDTENKVHAEEGRLKAEKERSVAEASQLKGRCREAEARADAADERGKLVAAEAADARRSMGEEARMIWEMEE